MQITQHIQKWGNGKGLRLPKKVLEAANWEEGQTVSIDVHGDAIILSPVKEAKKLTLEDLLEGVTPDNVHGEMDWGPPAGKEIW